MTKNETLKQIRIDTKLGHFCGHEITPSMVLSVVVLRANQGQQFYGGQRYGAGAESKPVCRSEDGIAPAIPFMTVNAFGRHIGGLAPTCASCPQNQKDTPSNSRCQRLWNLTVLLDTGEVRKLLLNQASQSALEQWIYRLQAHIQRLNEQEGANLRLCDFAFTLTLEKRKGMYSYSLAYPVGLNEQLFQRIPFSEDGQSKFQQRYVEHNPTVLKQEAENEKSKAVVTDTITASMELQTAMNELPI